VYLSSQPAVAFAASIPSASVAGRIFRELSFLPRWHTGMLLLQEIPFLRAFGGEIRFRLGDNTLALPGYMLADLDYTRGAQPGERATRYESYAGAFAADPELREQLLLRLKQEAAALPADAVIRVLRAVSSIPPSPTLAAILTDLWHRLEAQGGEEPVAELIQEIQFRWPEGTLAGLGEMVRIGPRRAR
jgi:hypothetical protein